jgi:hypothetical protein
MQPSKEVWVLLLIILSYAFCRCQHASMWRKEHMFSNSSVTPHHQLLYNRMVFADGFHAVASNIPKPRERCLGLACNATAASASLTSLLSEELAALLQAEPGLLLL